jgi:HSP20 family molecular chaperone IbpA
MEEQRKERAMTDVRSREMITPAMCACSSDDGKKMHMEFELPGVKMEDINLMMKEDSFCIRATRDDVEFHGDYDIFCPIDPDKTEAKYVNGLLSIDAPYKEEMTTESKKIRIESVSSSEETKSSSSSREEEKEARASSWARWSCT